MTNTRPSIPFRKMYYSTVDKYINEACVKCPNYAVKTQIKNKNTNIAIWEAFETYRFDMLQKVKSKRLDRHKLAACLCGAILEAQPLMAIRGRTISKNANEILALYSSIALLKYFMISEKIATLNLSEEESDKMYDYLDDHFSIQFPQKEDNICDKQEYRKNIVNALFWSRSLCKTINRECLNFEPWAYATIFYHVEALNKQKFIDVCNAYETEQANNTK